MTTKGYVHDVYKQFEELNENNKKLTKELEKANKKVQELLLEIEKINNIPHFDIINQYIVDHKLQDSIVEFSLFNKDVGIKKEKVIVYELRTHY